MIIRGRRFVILCILCGCASVFASALLCASAPSARAYISTGDGSWVWQNPLPQGDSLESVTMVDAESRLGSGRQRHHPAGRRDDATWLPQNSGTTQDLYGVSFPDSSHGWAVAGAAPFWPQLTAAILGRHRPRVPPTGSQRSRSPPLCKAGRWAHRGSSHPECLGTASSIQQMAVPLGARKARTRPPSSGTSAFQTAAMVGQWATTGMLAQASSRLRLTAASLGPSRTPASPKAGKAVWFSDASHGWVVGDGGAGPSWHTTNGGTTWTAPSRAATRLPSAVCFNDDTHGYAVGYGGAILATTDGGAHWNVYSKRGIGLGVRPGVVR